VPRRFWNIRVVLTESLRRWTFRSRRGRGRRRLAKRCSRRATLGLNQSKPPRKANQARQLLR
jgi:hypothetical protein